VTTCNRCGGVLPATATVCQHCGMPVQNITPGFNVAGPMGARQRAQRRERASAAFPPVPDLFAMFPPSPPAGPSPSAQPPRPPDPREASSVGQWRSTSLIDPNQLPPWLNPSSPETTAHAGEGSARPQPAGYPAPQPAQPGPGTPSFSMPPASPAPPRPPARPAPGASPYLSSGRRSTDDLFAASSLLDRTRLPDWLSSGQNRPARPATPPAGGVPAARPGSPPPVRPGGSLGTGSRPSQNLKDQDADLPDWLRAMDPGAPPSTAQFTSGSMRSQPGGNYPPAANRPPAQEKQGAPGGAVPGTDPFSISRVEAVLPPLDASSGPARSALAGSPDPFAARSPLGQTPRQSGPMAGMPGSQGFPAPAPQQSGSSRTSGSRPESRTTGSFAQPGEPWSAGSLVQPDMLPEWLRQGSSGESTAGRPMPSGPAAASHPPGPARAGGNASIQAAKDSSAFPQPTSTTPFDSASLVDESALPGWLRSSSETEPLPLPFTVSDSVGGKNAGSAESGKKPDSVAARDKTTDAADEEKLPEWLRQVYSEAQVPPLSQDAPSAGSSQQPTLSAAELLDEQSVPAWIREAPQTSPLPKREDIPSSTPPAQGQAGPGSRAGASQSPPDPSGGPGGKALSVNALIDEANLPEWLRKIDSESASLSAPQAAAPSGLEAGAQQRGGASGVFSAAELINTQALPAWLKTQGTSNTLEKASGSAEPAGPSGSTSSVFSAAELVDTQALPAWLKTEAPKAEPEKAADATGQSGSSDSPSDIFSAAELIDTQSLPAWLKAEEAKAGPEKQTSSTESAGPSGSTSSVLSAAELVDTQALPAWLKAQEPGAEPSPSTSGGSGALESKPAGSSKISPMPAGFSGQRSGVFSAAALVDTQALPAWLKSGTAGSGAGSQGASQSDQQGQMEGKSGEMPAAELVDTQSLPAWLRDAESSTSVSVPSAASTGNGMPSADATGQTGGFSAASLVDPDALPAWLQPAQSGPLSMPPAQVNGSPPTWERDTNEQSGFAAASLIDPNGLPEWLRNPEGLQRPGALQADGGPDEGPHARVPHRPRLPVEPNRAPSQAAASVFSSVLGPAAGEEQWKQTQSGRPGRPASGPLAGQSGSGPLRGPRPAQDWESGEMSGRNQPPPRSTSQPQAARRSGPLQQGEFAGGQQSGFDQGAPRDAGDWQRGLEGGFASMGAYEGSKPEQARPGSRVSGPLPPTQRGRQHASEPGDPKAPEEPMDRRQAGRAAGDSAFGPPEGRNLERYGEQGYDDHPPGLQRRRSAQRAEYQSEYDGWEGGPAYDPGFAGDDEVGPPSGVFAKLKRMLGFGG
jgi:hypothetical protein